MLLKNIIQDFFGLLYPKLCYYCDNLLIAEEKVVCFSCNYDLPKGRFSSLKNNPTHSLFWGRIPLRQAYSWLSFNKHGKAQTLFHQLKYQHKKDIGYFLGRSLGKALHKIDSFDAPDVIIPVPLHWKKERKRGCNQSLLIAEGLSTVLESPVNSSSLQRIYSSETQTHKKTL
mgnify:CR=1 FL=1